MYACMCQCLYVHIYAYTAVTSVMTLLFVCVCTCAFDPHLQKKLQIGHAQSVACADYAIIALSY